MADDKKLAWYQEFGQDITSGVNNWDNFANSMVDTIAPGKSQIDGLISDFSNSNMLSNLLTSNSPTLNIKQGLEELCHIIVNWDEEDFSINALITKLGKFLTKLFRQITIQLIKAIYNAVLKLRRMVISKLNAFLSEYVADACIQGLKEHLTAIANPANALSIDEFVSSVGDILTDIDKNVSDVLETIRTTCVNTYNFLTGSKYSAAVAEHEARLASYDMDVMEIEMQLETELATAMGDEEAIEAAYDVYYTEMEALGAALQNAYDAMTSASKETIWAGAFWSEVFVPGLLEMLNDFLCSRTASYVQNSDFGLKAGIQNEIKKHMQGCLFQQMIKTSNKIAPGSLTSDVMNRINNLAQNGNMMDAYNVALAAGFDLSGSDFQVQLPSANGWVSQIYGDPYAFAPETPINAAGVAKYLTDDLPTTEELITGNISEDKLNKPYIADNWNESDSAAAAASNRLNNAIAMNNAIIDGVDNIGRTMNYKEYSASITSTDNGNVYDINESNNTANITAEMNRSEVEAEYLS